MVKIIKNKMYFVDNSKHSKGEIEKIETKSGCNCPQCLIDYDFAIKNSFWRKYVKSELTQIKK